MVSIDNVELEETSEGIEMKRYLPKDIMPQEETPVLSNDSSRSTSPQRYVTPEETEVEVSLDSIRSSVTKRGLQIGSGHSSTVLLEGARDGHERKKSMSEE
ncbi:unnamed protein product [Strongylus vulgaris]|uniref:Uncharacterized protein n=1 Tax=Strongylus vulgaris TaxID=40348 RepID=A0A3P7J672_STRVU|nr:unnamed protein product [Strongylus vulgaris]